MSRSLKDKIAVAAMFGLVLTVFSFANRDTQKIIALHSKSALQVTPKPLEASVPSVVRPNTLLFQRP